MQDFGSTRWDVTHSWDCCYSCEPTFQTYINTVIIQQRKDNNFWEYNYKLNHVQQTFNEDECCSCWYESQTSYQTFVNYKSYCCLVKVFVDLKYNQFWHTYMRSFNVIWKFVDLTTFSNFWYYCSTRWDLHGCTDSLVSKVASPRIRTLWNVYNASWDITCYFISR